MTESQDSMRSCALIGAGWALRRLAKILFWIAILAKMLLYGNGTAERCSGICRKRLERSVWSRNIVLGTGCY